MTRLSLLLLSALLAFAPAVSARTQTTLLRDADIEYSLRQLAKPILTAAGLNASRIRILLVDDSSLNAFIVDNSHIFIHSGLMMKLDTPAQLQAVIAHEAAHIANGHISRRLGNLSAARNAAALGTLLGVMAGAAARDGRAGLAIAAGSSNSAMRLFLSHTRAEEASADISSARYLRRAGVDLNGAVEVMRIFRGQELLRENRQDPYVRTHPLSRDRLRALEGLAASQPAAKPDPAAQYWFARARGKLTGFQRAPNWTLRRAGNAYSQDIGFMRQAAAYHRQSNRQKAVASIDRAIALRPRDPFYLELKGQILLESRQFDAAVQVYRQAASLAPREPLILGGLGRAYLAAGNPREALKALEAARGRDFSDARVLRDLSVAYARTGQNAMASVVTAERYALQGRLKDAEVHARRALGQLPRGSGPWQRAQDVLGAAERAARRR
ncbi:M48 family metalloprotease [Cognatishimia sp. F0-27]|uniref:M48 family metalloprotease n=1 Tax=Cognatishimia sp. F0-27 TaxID=2816855 RepID=UPI001D0C8D89|nr:M48 family metalloprotease [Cognatishimia sp. F0-27]MCC1491910.1 M48 family metalloprotease [Cognatishimia sp. F0-27]